MKRLIPYTVFAAVYGLLLLLAGLATNQIRSEAISVVVEWAAPFAVAPVALLIALRLGHLNRLGIAISSVLLAIIIGSLTVGILVAVAMPVIDGATLDYLASMVVSYFTIGGWRMLLSIALFVVAPLLWALLLHNRMVQPARAVA